MRFYCVSDIHSHFTPLKEALDKAGFDKDNPTHYLISCGDALDRGNESEEVLHFLMSLERKILIKGNHDLLLEDLCKREFPYSYDFSNGSVKTINAIGGAGEGYPFDKCCENTWNRTAAYRASLVNYFETENYIFVHSFIPLKCLDDLPKHYVKNRQFEYSPDWRNADRNSWEQAMWGNPFELASQGFNKTGKTIVYGHFHTSWPRAAYEGEPEFGDSADFSPYYGDGYIAIDACTAASGKVNVVVLEDNFITKEGN
jgi:serine/threonine protein phosphatase 1